MLLLQSAFIKMRRPSKSKGVYIKAFMRYKAHLQTYSSSSVTSSQPGALSKIPCHPFRTAVRWLITQLHSHLWDPGRAAHQQNLINLYIFVLLLSCHILHDILQR